LEKVPKNIIAIFGSLFGRLFGRLFPKKPFLKSLLHFFGKSAQKHRLSYTVTLFTDLKI